MAPRPAGVTECRRWSPRTDLLVVVSLVVLAVLTRMRPLGPESLWLDDAWVGLVARVEGMDEFARVSATHPGFSGLLYGWTSLVGNDEVSFQAIPLLAGVLTPALVYWWWKRPLGRPGAAVASILLLSAPVVAEFSSRVKPYTLEVLIAVGIISLALRAIEEDSPRYTWVSLTVAAIIGSFISLAVIPVVAGCLVAMTFQVLVGRTGRGRALGLTVAAYCVFVGPMALYVTSQTTGELEQYWEGYYIDLGSGIHLALEDLALALERLVGGFSALPVVLVLVFLALASALLLRRRPAVLLMGLTPVLMALVAAVASMAPLGGGRTDSYLYAGLALIAGASVGVIRSRRATHAVAAAVAVLVVLAGVPIADSYPPEPLSAHVSALEEAQYGETILMDTSTHYAYALYSDAAIEIEHAIESANGFTVRVLDDRVVVVESVDEVPAAVGDSHGVWYVGSHTERLRPEINGVLEQMGFELVSVIEDQRVWVSHWVSP